MIIILSHYFYNNNLYFYLKHQSIDNIQRLNFKINPSWNFISKIIKILLVKINN